MNGGSRSGPVHPYRGQKTLRGSVARKTNVTIVTAITDKALILQ